MPKLPESKSCFGCGACSNICVQKCIKMQLNSNGEVRPVVYADKCIECRQCEKVCPTLNKVDMFTPKEVYAMTLSDLSKKGCASGGAAYLLYKKALKERYMVFGCSFDDKHILRMTEATKEKDIEKFKNSKYTFCRMDDTYVKIAQQLDKGNRVLFVGLSCQVAALNLFFNNKNEKLITVDLICHGVPPEQYLREYLIEQEKKFSKINTILFRGENRQNDYHVRLFRDGKCIYDKFAREDLYFAGYVNCLIFEEKCYQCPYAQKNRVSDITIGDWNGPTCILNQKLSLVFANTDKGVDFVKTAFFDGKVLSEKHTLEEAVSSNDQLRKASKIPDDYYAMRESYQQNGFSLMAKKFILPYIKKYKLNKRKEKMMRILPISILIKIKKEVLKI